MRYKILPHTADLRLKVYGKDLEELFQNAVLGLASVLVEDAEKLSKKTRGFVDVSAEGPDEAALLVNFLNDALTASHTDKKIYPRAKILRISPTSIHAQISGAPVLKFDKDVKAVSHHGAEIKKNKKGVLETILVLDI